MITTARPLPISKILKRSKTVQKTTVWCGKDQEEILTYKSWVSLKLILQWAKEQKGSTLNVYIPKFYCYDTIYNLQDEVNFVYYDINEGFIPDYKQCTRLNETCQVDVFVLVHYFGIPIDANDAKVFCKKTGAILVEDAVHVLIGEDKIGRVGDFVLYSPWKNCGLPDGAILIINSKGVNLLDTTKVRQRLIVLNDKNEILPKEITTKWKLKKLVQKILPNRKNSLLEQDKTSFTREQSYQISRYSKNILLEMTYEEVAELGDKKRINALLLEKYLKDKCAFEWINNKKNPYAMTLYMNKEERKKAWECVNKLGEVTYTWPDINPLFKEDINLYNLKDSMLHIAVHDGMTPGYIYRKLKKNESISMQKPVTIYEVLSDEYKKLCQHAEKPIPLLQSNIYAEAKSRTQGWKEQYWVVKSGNEIVAFFLTLKKYGFVYRINRGPYLTDENYKMETYNIIQKKFGKKGRILFFAPEDQQTGESINEMLQAGYKYRKCYFSTGYIDLSMPEETIRKNMESKWRNQLKAAEKASMSLYEIKEKETFHELLQLHAMDKEKRKYSDSGDMITENLFNAGGIKGYYVKGENEEIISFVMVAVHEGTATYYIGWSNLDGYRKNANRYLLWEIIRQLKHEGYKWFDLGGIDMIHTKNIAEFKLGTGCKYLNLVGEYLSF
jgi:hypothetical protein